MSRGIHDKVNKKLIPTAGNSSGGSENAYKTTDAASSTINDTDYIPMLEGTTKKKTLWSTIVEKIKTSLSTVATSGNYNDLSNKPGVATTSANGLMSSADKLSVDRKSYVVTVPMIDYQNLPSKSTVSETYFKEWLVYVVQNYPYVKESSCVVLSVGKPNSRGVVIGDFYVRTPVHSTTGLPQYCSFLYSPIGGGVSYNFGTANYVYYFSAAFRGDSTGTYTYASGSTGGTVDLGARNTYRYVNAANVYSKGRVDCGTSKILDTAFSQNTYGVSTTPGDILVLRSDSALRIQGLHVSNATLMTTDDTYFKVWKCTSTSSGISGNSGQTRIYVQLFH